MNDAALGVALRSVTMIPLIRKFRIDLKLINTTLAGFTHVLALVSHGYPCK